MSEEDQKIDGHIKNFVFFFTTTNLSNNLKSFLSIRRSNNPSPSSHSITEPIASTSSQDQSPNDEDSFQSVVFRISNSLS